MHAYRRVLTEQGIIPKRYAFAGVRETFVAHRAEVVQRVKRDKYHRLSKSFVPICYRTTNAGNKALTTFERAQYILIDQLPYSLQDMTMSYDFYGSVVAVKVLSDGEKSYVYYKVDQYLNPTSTSILAALSRHYMDDFTGYYNDWANVDNVFFGLQRNSKSRQHWDVARLKHAPKPKISGEHHIHFTAAEVWDSLDAREQAKAGQAFRLPADSTTSMLGGVMLWLASLDDVLYESVINTCLLDAPDVKTFAKIGKTISVRAKSFQNIVQHDLRAIFEIDVLVNRDVGEVDWEGEKLNRTEPVLANLSYRRVYQRALAMFKRSDATKEKPRNLTWEKFWEARWQWSASGSIHSQYPEDLIGMPKARELRNKFINLIMQPEVKIDKYLNRKPRIEAWSSIKYEWGKMRAIYGTDLTSYVLSHFGFFNCEDTLPNDFPVGAKARPSFVSAKVTAVLENTVPLCIDFEDFNSQHSNDAMKAVVDAYLEAYRDDLSPEQQLAVEWTRDSIDQTFVHDNMGTKTTYHTNGTLMSGWRLTTFVNSVLNYIYTKEIIDGCKGGSRSVHNGDDVLLGITNFDTARLSAYTAKKMNIRLQRKKCAFGGIAEFLRVDHRRGEHGQYLTRNIATLMHSRIESKVAINVRDVTEAMESRFLEFVQRGGDLDTVARLRDTYYNRVAEVYHSKPEDLYLIKNSHRVVGGISVAQEAPIGDLVVLEKQEALCELPEKLPGVDAYAKTIHRVLDLKQSVGEVRKRIYKATLNAVQLTRSKVVILKNENVEQYRVYRALYKAHEDVATLPMFGKAMLTGFVFDVLAKAKQMQGLSRILESSKDPMRFLSILV
nr:RNA-dependent RNA polymerase [Umbelopsis gibberispora virus 2]